MRKKLGFRIKEVGLGLVCTLLLAVTGCISSDCTVSYGPQGPPVEKNTLRKIKCGQTPRRWVVATLGNPTTQNPAPGGGEILCYQYCKRVKSDFAMFPPPLSFSKDKEYHTSIFFEVREGVVTRYWKEQ